MFTRLCKCVPPVRSFLRSFLAHPGAFAALMCRPLGFAIDDPQHVHPLAAEVQSVSSRALGGNRRSALGQSAPPRPAEDQNQRHAQEDCSRRDLPEGRKRIVIERRFATSLTVSKMTSMRASAAWAVRGLPLAPREQAHIASREGGALLLTPHARGGVRPPPEASPHARGGVPPPPAPSPHAGGWSWPRTPPETRGQTLRALDFTPHFAVFSRGKSSFGAT